MTKFSQNCSIAIKKSNCTNEFSCCNGGDEYKTLGVRKHEVFLLFTRVTPIQDAEKTQSAVALLRKNPPVRSRRLPQQDHNRNYVTSQRQPNYYQITGQSQKNNLSLSAAEMWNVIFYIPLLYILPFGWAHRTWIGGKSAWEIVYWPRAGTRYTHGDHSVRKKKQTREAPQQRWATGFYFLFLALACLRTHMAPHTHTRLQLFPVNKTWYPRHCILWISHII